MLQAAPSSSLKASKFRFYIKSCLGYCMTPGNLSLSSSALEAIEPMTSWQDFYSPRAILFKDSASHWLTWLSSSYI